MGKLNILYNFPTEYHYYYYQMQDLGQPPASMLEELAGPGGLNLGPGGIPEDLKDLENCNIM